MLIDLVELSIADTLQVKGKEHPGKKVSKEEKEAGKKKLRKPKEKKRKVDETPSQSLAESSHLQSSE